MDHRNNRRSAEYISYTAHSVVGGAGGRDTRISTATLGPRVGRGLGGGYDYQPLFVGFTPADLAIANEKILMQQLNERLAKYLAKIEALKKAKVTLEVQISEYTEKKGPLGDKDNSKYKATIADLKNNIIEKSKRNTRLLIEVDNARLASTDFRYKMEHEQGLRLTVEADISNLRKMIDDCNMTRMHLESTIEGLKEEIILMDKNHDEEKGQLINQQVNASINVDVDAPKGQDLARVLEEMRDKYEKIALKNQEEVKVWHESQMKEVTVQVTQSTKELKESTGAYNDLKKKCQSLEVELQAALNMKGRMEANLNDAQMNSDAGLEQYYRIIPRRQEELAKIRTEITNKKRDYENLLNIKVKLEAEIAEYRRLLDGDISFKLEDALQKKKVVTQVVTTTQTLVNGKVVSEDRDIKSTEALVTSKK